MAFDRVLRGQVFDQLCSGSSLAAAGRAVGVSKTTAKRWWVQAGGMDLNKGAVGGLGDMISVGIGGRGHRLSLAERETIMVGVILKVTPAATGRVLSRDRSVISRELARNSNLDGTYHALLAHWRAAGKAKRPKRFKLVDHPQHTMIEEALDCGWSPRLIADVLKILYPDDKLMWVSHETIYQALYVQTRGSLRADLHKTLSTRRAARKPRDRESKLGKPFRDAFTIADRPEHVEKRKVPGHWEGDLIMGSDSSAIGTLVERSTRFTILLHLPADHRAETVAEAMIAAMNKLPEHLLASITWDRGTELAGYRDIQLKLDLPVYFCDPHSPWQRGTNENTNRLLRHWFAKGSNLRAHTAADLQRVSRLLNDRPRPTLDYQTPAQALAKLIDTDIITAA
ncbi:UNVERIFIED_CONTAM: IS30 family transposase [Williamsia faeni]